MADSTERNRNFLRRVARSKEFADLKVLHDLVHVPHDTVADCNTVLQECRDPELVAFVKSRLPVAEKKLASMARRLAKALSGFDPALVYEGREERFITGGDATADEVFGVFDFARAVADDAGALPPDPFDAEEAR